MKFAYHKFEDGIRECACCGCEVPTKLQKSDAQLLRDQLAAEQARIMNIASDARRILAAANACLEALDAIANTVSKSEDNGKS